MNKKAILTSLIVVLLCGIATFWATVRYSRTQSVIKQDGLAYFLYTRSLVVDFDLDLTAEFAEIDRHFNPAATEAVHRYALHLPGTGRIQLPWPAGTAFVYFPFYLAGLGAEGLTAALTDRPVNTFGSIPQFFYAIGSLFFGILAFWLTLACARRAVFAGLPGIGGMPRLEGDAEPSPNPPTKTADRAPLVAVLAILFGGPGVFYVFFHPTMAHASSLGFTALLTYLWWRSWNEGCTVRRFAALGLVLGLLATLRYQNSLFAILLVALAIRELMRLGLRRAWRPIVTGIVASALPVALQVAHSLAVVAGAGDVAGSTQVAAEQNLMVWYSPHFFEVLFSCRHGAFYWAPILGIGFVGLAVAAWRAGWARVGLFTFLAHVYLIGTLSRDINWGAAAAFGMRYLVECSPLLVLGLLFLLRATASRVKLRFWTVGLSVLVAWNLLLIVPYSLQWFSQTECVTYPEMLRGVFRLIGVSL